MKQIYSDYAIVCCRKQYYCVVYPYVSAQIRSCNDDLYVISVLSFVEQGKELLL